jgi:hypothetical protein
LTARLKPTSKLSELREAFLIEYRARRFEVFHSTLFDGMHWKQSRWPNGRSICVGHIVTNKVTRHSARFNCAAFDVEDARATACITSAATPPMPNPI